MLSFGHAPITPDTASKLAVHLQIKKTNQSIWVWIISASPMAPLFLTKYKHCISQNIWDNYFSFIYPYKSDWANLSISISGGLQPLNNSNGRSIFKKLQRVKYQNKSCTFFWFHHVCFYAPQIKKLLSSAIYLYFMW